MFLNYSQCRTCIIRGKLKNNKHIYKSSVLKKACNCISLISRTAAVLLKYNKQIYKYR